MIPSGEVGMTRSMIRSFMIPSFIIAGDTVPGDGTGACMEGQCSSTHGTDIEWDIIMD